MKHAAKTRVDNDPAAGRLGYWLAPSGDVCSEAIGFCRPRSGTVRSQWSCIVKNRIYKRPCGLNNILANEKQFVPVHGIRQKTFIRALLLGFIEIGRLNLCFRRVRDSL